MLFKDAKKVVSENFTQLGVKLQQAIDQGFLDETSNYYNTITTLRDDVNLTQFWSQLNEIIYRGKSLEEDLDTWLSLKGCTTFSLPWPTENSDTETT